MAQQLNFDIEEALQASCKKVRTKTGKWRPNWYTPELRKQRSRVRKLHKLAKKLSVQLGISEHGDIFNETKINTAMKAFGDFKALGPLYLKRL